MSLPSKRVSFSTLPLPKGYVRVNCIWSGGVKKLRYTRLTILNRKFANALDLPHLTYDGSNAGQAAADRSKVMLKPETIYSDPFSDTTCFITVFDACIPGPERDRPFPINIYYVYGALSEKARRLEVCSKFEQEYFLINRKAFHKPLLNLPLPFPAEGERAKCNPHSCGAGPKDLFERSGFESCPYAGVKIFTRANGKVSCGCWEFQTGLVTVLGRDDILWTAKCVLKKSGIWMGLIVNYDLQGNKCEWNTRPKRCEINYKEHSLPATPEPQSVYTDNVAICRDCIEEHLTPIHESGNAEGSKYGISDHKASNITFRFQKSFKSWFIVGMWWLVMQFEGSAANEFNCVCGKSPSASTLAVVAIVIAIIGAVAQIVAAIINKKL